MNNKQPEYNIHLKISDQDKIRYIKFMRPEKKNALTQNMYRDLAYALKEVENNPDLHLSVITGSEDSFTSGNDLNDFLINTSNTNETEINAVEMFLKQLIVLKKPVIAAVNGISIGIGVTLLLHCDYILSVESARFSTPFIDLGLCPEAASSQLLPLRIGDLNARRLLLLGEQISAQTALEWGLINQIVLPEDLDLETQKIASKLLEKPIGALQITKSLLRRKFESLNDRIEHENHIFLKCLQSKEFLDSVHNFMLKNKNKDFNS